MDTRYIDAERKLAASLEWTEAAFAGAVDEPSWRTVGLTPRAIERSCIPAWARSNDDCVTLMIEHVCFVHKEKTTAGESVMVARWHDKHGFVERISVPISDHASEAAAFRYAAVLGVTSKVDTESRARELGEMVAA
ncbi:hypothetical protein [Massilia orientalis]|uniref:Uncharacterized protein n=1 Tax=Massilia orientalis TaxID=3050128 RepID=A0ACC7MJV9_9BURK|nr:hypothetical protein [Massilia sp. YIM B02787]